MTSIKKVGVKELKNKLSAYLREVRSGQRILVTDRGVVIAELHSPQPLSDPAEIAMKEWLETGAIVAPSRDKLPLPEPLVQVPAGTSGTILDELRGAD